MDIIKVFGDNLKKYRTAMGISQEAFAEKCGMHRTYISAIECYRRSISLENIQRIADALEIQPKTAAARRFFVRNAFLRPGIIKKVASALDFPYL